jgi:hypothetical protein
VLTALGFLRRGASPLAGVAVTAILAAGCGTAPTPRTTGPVTQTNQSTAASAPTSPATTPTAGAHEEATHEEATHESTGTVPNETGLELRVAERNLRIKRVPYKVLRRSPSAAAVSTTWLVCTSNPAPRSHLESGTVVKLIVAPSCR